MARTFRKCDHVYPYGETFEGFVNNRRARGYDTYYKKVQLTDAEYAKKVKEAQEDFRHRCSEAHRTETIFDEKTKTYTKKYYRKGLSWANNGEIRYFEIVYHEPRKYKFVRTVMDEKEFLAVCKQEFTKRSRDGTFSMSGRKAVVKNFSTRQLRRMNRKVNKTVLDDPEVEEYISYPNIHDTDWIKMYVY